MMIMRGLWAFELRRTENALLSMVIDGDRPMYNVSPLPLCLNCAHEWPKRFDTIEAAWDEFERVDYGLSTACAAEGAQVLQSKSALFW